MSFYGANPLPEMEVHRVPVQLIIDACYNINKLHINNIINTRRAEGLYSVNIMGVGLTYANRPAYDLKYAVHSRYNILSGKQWSVRLQTSVNDLALRLATLHWGKTREALRFHEHLFTGDAEAFVKDMIIVKMVGEEFEEWVNAAAAGD